MTLDEQQLYAKIIPYLILLTGLRGFQRKVEANSSCVHIIAYLTIKWKKSKKLYQYLLSYINLYIC